MCVYLNLNFSCVLCYRYRSLFQIKVCVCSVFFFFGCCCLVLMSETLQVSRNTQKWHGHASELRAEHFFFFWMCIGKTQNALYFWCSINIFCHQKTCHKKIFTASILWLLYVHVSNHRMIEVKATGSGAQGCFSQQCIIHCLEEG